ncbi:MAG: T9SS type A sorting domain-containing protein [Candidatus Zixiibacteriota bacterium]|nr:MAG: T9SS type A sorting domain-containing protein [candidate division Zixibacteria bacterium]
MYFKQLISIALAALILPSLSFSQNSWNMELIGKAAHDGSLEAYSAYEDYLYIITEKNNPTRFLLSVVDIRNPLHPHRVQTMCEGEVGQTLIVVDSLLYVIDKSSDTLIIFSLNVPTAPVEIDRVSIGQYFENFERLTENILGCPQFYNYKLIDIHDAMNPYVFVDVNLTYIATEGQLMGNYLFISGHSLINHYSYLEVFDISDTLNPISVYFCQMYLNAYPRIQIIDHYLYYSFLPNGIRLFEIRDPSDPILLDTVMVDYQIFDMQLSGDQLILMGGFDSLLTIDVTDPARPFVTGAYYNQGGSYLSQLIENRLYIISNGDVISWFDMEEPQNPQLIGRYIPYSNTRDIAKSENYVYTSVNYGGFRIFDVSNPVDPVGIGYYKSDYQSTKIRVFDDILFLADNYAGVRIFSLASPLNPVLLSTVFFESNAYDMFCSDSLLYMACDDGFRIVNISDPAYPAILGYYATPQFHNNYSTIISNHSLVYTSESDSGICIYNVSDPTNPIKIHCLDIPYHPAEFFLRDSLLYAATYLNGLIIFDLSNISLPVLISSTPPSARALYLHDNHAYLANSDGLRVFEISNPYNPEYISGYFDDGYFTGVVAENDTAYVSAGPQGMWIVRNEITTTIEDFHSLLPKASALSNYPNPFNAITTIKYYIPNKSEISLSIYNLLGQRVETLFEGVQNPGEHMLTWDASHLPSGIYFARLETGNRSENIKMVFLK